VSDTDGPSLEGIAIVGMAGRFPGAGDVSSFWENIKGGVESITHFSDQELEVPPPGPANGDEGSAYVASKGVLEGVDLFDARFFGYLPREAELMDPQQRVFLELAWEAFEYAGCDPERFPGAVGVFAGCYIDTYLLSNLCSNPGFLQRLVDSIQVGSLQTELGNDKDYLATRVSFKLGLRGPAVTVQSACSTSLVSIALACQSLLAYQCDMALAGGATITFPQKKGYFYREGGMLSSDGHCRPFDERAEGTVFSNGAAVVVLKRLSEALADGDTIHSVIIGSAINNDGSQKVSYTAPSVDGQAEVIALALDVAGVSARTIGYIEAHGTATPLGDPIEIAGLTKAFRQTTDETGYCAIGSAKSNLGHLDVASGAVGVIKTAFALRDKVLPPILHFERPNPKIDFGKTPFYVNAELRPWDTDGGPRRAGVSSFGVGGTNAHLILEEPPEAPERAPGRGVELLTLSARSESSLAAQSLRLAEHLRVTPGLDLADVAFTLQTGRRAFPHRRIVVCSAGEDALGQLERDPSPGETGRPESTNPPLVFLFPGQGAQYPGMARGLYESEGVVRDTFDDAARLTKDDLGLDLRSLLLPEAGREEEAARTLAQTQYSQPALLTVEVALGRLLASWGLRPSFVVGHSIGEFSAACVAEVFDLDTALRLVAARGRLMQQQEPGRMLAVRAPAGQVEALLPEGVALAAVNGPALCVVSGPIPAIEAFAAALRARDVVHSVLRTSHAFHSSMMDAAVGPLVEEVARAQPRPPTVPIVSTALARVLDPGEATDPDYWGRQLRQTVRFAETVEHLATDASRLFVEVGPGQTLTTLTRQTTKPLGKRTVVPCLGPLQSPGNDVEQLLGALGRLWLAGVDVDFERLARRPRRRVPLPTYPFERKRYWVEPARSDSRVGNTAVAAGNGDPTATGASQEAIARTEELLRQQVQLMTEQLAVLGRRE